MATWTPIKPKFKKECLLLTASEIRGEWAYNSWWIRKYEDGDGWYWELCTIDGDEWGDLEELEAQLYKIVPIPELQTKPQQ